MMTTVPEIQSHAFGGVALLDGLSTVSKGETILNLGKSAVKHAGNWFLCLADEISSQ